MLPANIISPAPRDTWRRIAAQDQRSLVFHTPEWTDCIRAIDGNEDASRLYEFPDGAEVLLPMVRRRYLGGAIATASALPPNWGIGGLIATAALQQAHMQTIIRDLEQQRNVLTDIWPNPLENQLWEKVRPPGAIALPRLSHVLSLEGGFETVWTQRFTSQTRNHVRKAERSGITVESDATGKLVPAFHELFSMSIERWARQQHEPARMARWRARRRDPLRKFHHVARAMGPACRIWLARKDGVPAAGIVVFQGRNATYQWGAMNKEVVGGTHANELLHTRAIEEACLAGCCHYHMGESGESTALAHFKERFGAEPYRYFEYRLERLPLTAADRAVRSMGKRLIGFKDA